MRGLVVLADHYPVVAYLGIEVFTYKDLLQVMVHPGGTTREHLEGMIQDARCAMKWVDRMQVWRARMEKRRGGYQE